MSNGAIQIKRKSSLNSATIYSVGGVTPASVNVDSKEVAGRIGIGNFSVDWSADFTTSYALLSGSWYVNAVISLTVTPHVSNNAPNLGVTVELTDFKIPLLGIVAGVGSSTVYLTPANAGGLALFKGAKLGGALSYYLGQATSAYPMSFTFKVTLPNKESFTMTVTYTSTTYSKQLTLPAVTTTATTATTTGTMGFGSKSVSF